MNENETELKFERNTADIVMHGYDASYKDPAEEARFREIWQAWHTGVAWAIDKALAKKCNGSERPYLVAKTDEEGAAATDGAMWALKQIRKCYKGNNLKARYKAQKKMAKSIDRGEQEGANDAAEKWVGWCPSFPASVGMPMADLADSPIAGRL